VNTAPAYVRDAATAAPAGTGKLQRFAVGSAFTVTQQQRSQGQFVVLVGRRARAEASVVATLNGHTETWSFNNFCRSRYPMIRSG